MILIFLQNIYQDGYDHTKCDFNLFIISTMLKSNQNAVHSKKTKRKRRNEELQHLRNGFSGINCLYFL